MSAERKPSGRPLRYGAKLRTVQVTLDAESIRKGREIGGGNLSVGIRAVLNPDASADAHPAVPAEVQDAALGPI